MLNELNSLPLFMSLSDESRQLLNQSGCYQGYQKGDVLVRENEPNDQLFVLLDGSIRIESQADELIVVLRRGAIIGEISSTGLSTLPIASAVAVNDVRVIAFPIQQLMAVSAQETEFADALRDLGMQRVISRVFDA